MNVTKIILIIAGAFAAYTLAILAYALLTIKTGLARTVFVAKYAPWLFISRGIGNYIYQGA